MRVKPLIRNFTAGEVAPQLDGLIDGPVQGCRTLENFIVRKQGGVERRPGTKYAGRVGSLLVGGDCESETAPYIRGDGSSISNCTFARDATEAHGGSYSYKLTKTNAAGTWAYAGFCDNGDTTDLHGLIPGRTYQLSAHVFVPNVGGCAVNEVRLYLSYYNDGEWTSAYETGDPTLDTWSFLTISEITIPATATGVRVYCLFSSTAENTEFFYIDDVELHQTNAPAVRIIPFQSTTGVWYIIEMGYLYARFWKVSTHAVMGGAGSETEVTTPYTTAQLRDVKYVVIKDYVYFTHPSHPVQRLKWTSDTSWTWEQAPITPSSKIVALGLDNNIYTQKSSRLEDPWSLMDNKAGTAGSGVHCIAYGKNMWVIATNTDIGISYDGETWISVEIPNAARPAWSVRYAKNVFMVTNLSGYICYSQDGINWTEVLAKSGAAVLSDSDYDPIEDDWCVVGGTNGEAAYSSDGGATWSDITSVTFSTNDNIHGVAYGSSTWVAVGDDGMINYTTSLSGTWTSVACGLATPGTLYDVQWFERLGMFMAAGLNGGMVYSSTGTAWTSVTSGVTGVIYNLVWDGGQIIGGVNTGELITSVDGENWSTISDITGCSASIRGLAVDYNKDEYDAEDFNQASHYPRACAYSEGRFLVANTATDPNKAWGSNINQPDAFHIGPYDSDAWEIVIGGRKQSRILWLEGASNLILGTDEREGIIIGGDAGITASNRRLLWQSTYGSDDTLQGLLINDAVIFAQRNAQIVRALRYQQTEQPPVELTYLADHIAVTSTGEGIVEWDHQKTPDSIIWAIRDDGELLSLSYDPGIGITAWARHPTRSGDTWESVAVAGGSTEDSVWLVSVRSIDGSTARYIEYMETRDFDNKEEAHFVDCGFESTIDTNQYTGLTALEGETVDVLTNGNVVSSNSVASGIISFTSSVASQIVHVGLPYDSTLQTTRLRTGSAWGENVGLKMNIPKVYSWFYNSIGGKIGPTETNTNAISYDSDSDLTTDLVEVALPSYHNEDGYLWVIQDDPLPMTLLALSPEVKMGER